MRHADAVSHRRCHSSAAGAAWILEGFGIIAVAPVSLGGPSIVNAIIDLLAIVAGGGRITL